MTADIGMAFLKVLIAYLHLPREITRSPSNLGRLHLYNFPNRVASTLTVTGISCSIEWPFGIQFKSFRAR